MKNQIRMAFAIVGSISLFFNGASTFAGVHDYHPDITIYMGAAFDPMDPDNDKSNNGCFEIQLRDGRLEAIREDELSQLPRARDSYDQLQNLGIPEINIASSEVRNRNELYKAIGVSSNISARLGIKNGINTTDYSYQSKLDENSVSYVVTANLSHFDEVVDAEISLTRQGRRILNRAGRRKDPELFFETCGREIVTRITRGVKTNIVYNFEGTSAYEATELRNSLSGNFGSFSGKVDFSQKTKSISEYASYSYQIIASGDPVFSSQFAQLVSSDPGDLDAIKSAMTNYLIDMANNPQSNHIVRFATADLSSQSWFVERFENYDFSEQGRIRNELDRIHSDLTRLQSYRDQLDSLENSYNDQLYQASALEILHRDQIAYQNAFDSLYASAIKCANATSYSDCSQASVLYIPVDPTRYLSAYIKFVGWNINTELFDNPNGYWRSGRARGHLIVDVTNPDLISRVDFRDGFEVFRSVSREEIRDISATGIIRNAYIHETAPIWGYKENPNEFTSQGPRAENEFKQIIRDKNGKFVARVVLLNGKSVDIPVLVLEDQP